MKTTRAQTARIGRTVLTVMVVGAASAAAATPAWAATQIPTLTNDVGRLDSDAGWQMLVGVGLLVAGLLIALASFAAHRLHASRIA
jgi:hypothetical protein